MLHAQSLFRVLDGFPKPRSSEEPMQRPRRERSVAWPLTILARPNYGARAPFGPIFMTEPFHGQPAAMPAGSGACFRYTPGPCAHHGGSPGSPPHAYTLFCTLPARSLDHVHRPPASGLAQAQPADIYSLLHTLIRAQPFSPLQLSQMPCFGTASFPLLVLYTPR